FALNLDSSVSVWAKDDGALQLTDGTVFNVASTNDPNVDPRIASTRQLITYKHVPAVAVVIGAPAIVAARMRLEACGMDAGKIVPLPQALASIGLDIGRAAKFAMLTHEDRA